jgi:hypothetical protein
VHNLAGTDAGSSRELSSSPAGVLVTSRGASLRFVVSLGNFLLCLVSYIRCPVLHFDNGLLGLLGGIRDSAFYLVDFARGAVHWGQGRGHVSGVSWRG